MQLPNASAAVVSFEKVTNYLLNPLHADGASKAKFFASHGFRVERWDDLAGALRLIAGSEPVTTEVDSAHGRKYIIDGTVETPRGTHVQLRTVWIIESDGDNPRFVTAYPCE